MRFERTNLESGAPIAGFVALGGGIERIEEATALARSHPEAQLVVTGHEALPAHFFFERGIARNRLLVEPTARNTYENAIRTAQLLGPKGFGRWIIVTSASHIPRAIGSFRKAGLLVEAWPVPDVAGDWMDILSRATHEWGGLIVYWLQGKTDSLFPSPQPPRNWERLDD
jgi:uncharacterized SAM-binding protein YcdF (DUF218 family)